MPYFAVFDSYFANELKNTISRVLTFAIDEKTREIAKKFLIDIMCPYLVVVIYGIVVSKKQKENMESPYSNLKFYVTFDFSYNCMSD